MNAASKKSKKADWKQMGPAKLDGASKVVFFERPHETYETTLIESP